MSGAELTTDRLNLERFTLDDGPFVLTLLNEPAFKRFIGDRGVQDLDAAREYLEAGPLAQYVEHGYGFYRVVHRGTNLPIGMCGLIRRAAFDKPDLGFAFLEASWGLGYALEAARAVLEDGHDRLAITEVLAFVDDDNARSMNLLRKLGFEDNGRVVMPGESETIRQLHRVFD